MPKVLFLSANPDGTSHLHLDEEVKKIDDCLRMSKLRDQFQLITKFAVDASTLRQALLEEDPDIIHFSGHGEGQAGLVLVGQDNKPKPATADALSALFKLFPKIKCVLLNACYAEEQAKAIVQHVAYVVGMKQAVRDDAAIAFATGFYDGLGYGRSIDDAFDLGRSAIQFELASFSNTTRKLIPVDFENVEALPDHLIPVLLKKEAGSTGSSISLTPSSSEGNSLVEKLQKDDISEAEALKMYRIRVQEFLIDRRLTQLEKVQLAILAKVLGLSETEANRILQEEQDKQLNVQSTTTQRSWFTRIGNAKKSLFACIAILAISGVLLASKQITDNMSNGKFILNVRSSKCIGVQGDDNTNGSPLVLSDCELHASHSSDSLATNKKWILESDGFIRNRKSEKCIDVKGSSAAQNGDQLQLWDCETSGVNRDNNSATDQKWALGTDGFIRNRKSEKCIDVKGSSAQNGDQLQLWDCETSGVNREDNNSATDQTWKLLMGL